MRNGTRNGTKLGTSAEGMQKRKPVLPPSRSVLILLPLTLIAVLDYAANALRMHRTDVIRRSLSSVI
jgi:hypothetical protein